MNNFNFQAMMEHGFLIIPKALLQQQIEDPNIEAGEIEALLKILMKVNYSDTLYSDRQHKDYLCKRGEACSATATGAAFSAGLSEKPSGSYTPLPSWGSSKSSPIPTTRPCISVLSNTTNG